MDLREAIHQRRAVRDYKPDPVSCDLLQQMIVTASWAPSAMNEQPWRFTAVTDRALLGEISALSKTAMLENVAAMPRENHFREVLSDPSFDIFYNAPALVVISGPAYGQWIAEDCALAAQNLMLAAHAIGLGTCWIGFAQGFLNTIQGRHMLNLSPDTRAIAPIIVGYPKASLPPVKRKTLAIKWITGPAISASP
jgi:nitroreductase